MMKLAGINQCTFSVTNVIKYKKWLSDFQNEPILNKKPILHTLDIVRFAYLQVYGTAVFGL